MAFRWMFFMRALMVDYEILRLMSFLMKCSCMAPLTPDVMVMRGLVFHPLFCMALIRGSIWYVCVRGLGPGICRGNI